MNLLVYIGSMLCSVLFALLGIMMLFSGGPPTLVAVVGAATLIYGFASLGALVAALRGSMRPVERINAVAAAAIILVWVASSLDYGSLSPLEVAGAGMLVLLTGLNWFAVRLAVRRTKTKMMGSQSAAQSYDRSR